MTTPILTTDGTGVRQDCQWSDWRHVRPGHQVALKGKGWIVSAKTDAGMTLAPVIGNGAALAGPPPDPGKQVLVLYPGHPMHVVMPGEREAAELFGSAPPAIAGELAVAGLTLHLGGRVLAVSGPDGQAPYECPPVAAMPPAHLRAHLVLFHEQGPGQHCELPASVPHTHGE